MLPEDYEMLLSDMVDWQCRTGICVENVARRVIQDLVERSLILRVGESHSDVPDFQQSNSVCHCMHDVVRESALRMLQYDMHNVLGDCAM